MGMDLTGKVLEIHVFVDWLLKWSGAKRFTFRNYFPAGLAT